MQRARVVGKATATIKHESMNSAKLLLVQPLGIEDRHDGFPLLVVDTVGAGDGNIVMITSDGRFARTALGTDKTPVRWTLIGIEDE
jgi:ethanolamine utilization protein EutN